MEQIVIRESVNCSNVNDYFMNSHIINDTKTIKNNNHNSKHLKKICDIVNSYEIHYSTSLR